MDNSPSQKNTNQQARTLPLIDTQQAYDELIDHLWDAQRIAFDTEFVPERTFQPVLCLIQIATDDVYAAIDTLAIKDLSEFWEIITREDVEIIVHAARAELEFCQLACGQLPERIFDTQLAAGIAGMGYPLSYTKLVKSVTSTNVSSSQTRTDWERRPLTEAQIAYALDDVKHLFALQSRIQELLHRFKRIKWYEEEIDRLKEHVQSNLDAERSWERTSGSGSLPPRGLAILRELVKWRRQRAQKLDRPLRQIMRDDQLIEIAKRRPRKPEDVDGVRGLGQLGQARWAQAVFTAIEDGLAVPESELPVRKPRSNTHRKTDSAHKLLGATLKQAASDHQIATSLLGTNEDVGDILEWHQHGRPSAHQPRLVRGWRHRVVGRTLLDLIDGKLTVGIIESKNHGLELFFIEEEDPQ